MAGETKNAAKKNAPRISAQDSSFATVLVGSEKKRFIVHQDLLTCHSEFFRAALMGKFKEADEKIVPLPEDDEVIFGVEEGQDEQDNEDDEAEEGELELDNLINLHVFANKYGVERLKKNTLNGLFMLLKQTHVDIHCRIDVQDWAKIGIRRYPSPFLVSVLERFTKCANGEFVVMDYLILCDYHEHKDEDERKSCPYKDVVM
ncbi:hypothetical protein B5807_03575 [Epicoccum nigrum]|uniref:BTB domain-containing protein n=1 Tax=Epicoccum nigrum TaxID=105696 RepID=A0A1Y2M8J9_EPING|nr:hypothetical protein B5807_03575 [Epicoccum nigrum]